MSQPFLILSSAAREAPAMFKHQCILLLGAVLVSLMATSSAEKVQFSSCADNPEIPFPCEVHEVRIDPCPEAATNEPCKLKRRHTANIQFDFTPGHSAERITAQAYWVSVTDLPLVPMVRDACLSTPCPVEANVQTLYNNTLTINKSFPIRGYDIKWKLWDNDVNPNFQCCFVTKIKLVR